MQRFQYCIQPLEKPLHTLLADISEDVHDGRKLETAQNSISS